MNRARLLYVLALVVASLLVAPALAQDAPPYLTHQGRLFDPNNQPITGVESMQFTLYDGPDPTAAALWDETLTVSLNNGFYTVTLGQITGLSPDLFDGSTRYLGLTVGGEQLNPLLPVHSVAYALHAGKAVSATSADTAENVTGNITPQSVTVGNTVIDGAGITINGQTVIDSTGAWQGAAPGVVVGAGLSGDGSAASPLGLDTSALATVATTGDYNDLSNTPITLSDLACADGEVLKYDAISSTWACATDTDTDTTYTATPTGGITIGAANDLAADTNILQSRVFGTCSAGFSIRQINPDGSVVCEDDTDTNTTYTAGTGLTLSAANQFDVDSTYVRSEAVTAMGAKANTNPLNHDRYTNTEAVAAMGAKANTNPLNHDRYTDTEAVAAMGVKANTNPLNHDRYTNAEAVAAVQSAPVNLAAGSTVGGVPLVVQDGSSPQGARANCRAINTAFPGLPNGLRWIDPDGAGGQAPFQAYCDMTTAGGGWTLVWKHSYRQAAQSTGDINFPATSSMAFYSSRSVPCLAPYDHDNYWCNVPSKLTIASGNEMRIMASHKDTTIYDYRGPANALLDTDWRGGYLGTSPTQITDLCTSGAGIAPEAVDPASGYTLPGVTFDKANPGNFNGNCDTDRYNGGGPDCRWENCPLPAAISGTSNHVQQTLHIFVR